MDSDEIYKIIGYTVAVIFFIYLISKAFSLNVRVIESFSGDDEEDNKEDKKSSGGRAIFLNNNKETEGVKDDDYFKKMINNMEKRNDEIKEYIIKKKDFYRDALSVQYNYYLYSLISVSIGMLALSDGSDDDGERTKEEREERERNRKEREENLMKYMGIYKQIKDYMGVLDFAFNEIDNIN